MDGSYDILDDLFCFIPDKFREEFKKIGIYQAILNGKISNSTEFYNQVPEHLLEFQRSDYKLLANGLIGHLSPGNLLQIGCGCGDLLKSLASLGISPIYGLDSCRGMVNQARKLLKGIDAVIKSSEAQTFSYSELAPLSNVIMNNFWGIMPQNESINLLLKLKMNLASNGRIIIGDLTSSDLPEKMKKALRYVEQDYGFIMVYPRFLHFSLLGFKEKYVKAGGGRYVVLSLA